MKVDLIATVSYDECYRLCLLMKKSGFTMSGMSLGLGVKGLTTSEMANVLFIALNHGIQEDFEDYLLDVLEDKGGVIH